MIQQPLPPTIINILTWHQTPDTLFSHLLPVLGEFLQCDRCFLYLRDPQTRLGKVPYCWVRADDVPMIDDEGWKLESESLPDKDPMFAAALRNKSSIFVEDVETADSRVLNRQFEQENFGHRSLIHGHLYHDGKLWGVLQPCIFGEPRVWTEYERLVITHVVQKIIPLAIAYVRSPDLVINN
jgi:GAF domain-containing protein